MNNNEVDMPEGSDESSDVNNAVEGERLRIGSMITTCDDGTVVIHDLARLMADADQNSSH